jgi:hypothetical protein
MHLAPCPALPPQLTAMLKPTARVLPVPPPPPNPLTEPGGCWLSVSSARLADRTFERPQLNPREQRRRRASTVTA